ncbi:hypothetical protein C8R46DRAFT_1044125 [Mycena filopes]|nr:hypothetical protein C8R46DRAFT_1044123 [Mycena filopes]KAJ7149724.1 hypothetical protein C8R46DRAFT_1044125 [Mycena filopes]
MAVPHSTNADSTAINQLECGAVFRIDLLMQGIHSAPASSIPDQDAWSSRDWSFSSSRPDTAAPSSVHGDAPEDGQPSVSVGIQPWESTNWIDPPPPSVSVEIEPWESTRRTELPPPSVPVGIEPWESRDWAEQPFETAPPDVDLEGRLSVDS